MADSPRRGDTAAGAGGEATSAAGRPDARSGGEGAKPGAADTAGSDRGRPGADRDPAGGGHRPDLGRRQEVREPSQSVRPDLGRRQEVKEPSQSVRPDLGRRQEVREPGSAPHQWAEDEVVQLHEVPPPSDHVDGPSVGARGDGSPPGDGPGDLDPLEVAGRAVEAAYADADASGNPLLTQETFEAAAQRAMDQAPPHPPWVKEVEFVPPGPAKEVEFVPPGPAKEVEFVPPGPAKEAPFVLPADTRSVVGPTADGAGDRAAVVESPRMPTEVHGPAEQRVVDGARARLEGLAEKGQVLGGDPVGRAEQWHLQGQNDRGYQQDCALAATAGVLRDCGVPVSESDVVDRASAAGLCETRNAEAADNGGVRDGEAIRQLLAGHGVESTIENPQSAEELAAYVEQGRGVIAEVDADELWGVVPTESSPAYYDVDGRSQVNHAVQVTGTVRDASGQLTGLVVNDTGREDGAGIVVPRDLWEACWTNTNNDHETVVTRLPTDVERATR